MTEDGTFSNWLLSLTNTCQVSSTSFCGLIALFFLLLSNIAALFFRGEKNQETKFEPLLQKKVDDNKEKNCLCHCQPMTSQAPWLTLTAAGGSNSVTCIHAMIAFGPLPDSNNHLNPKATVFSKYAYALFKII
jgi:hypothetical protein